jgi:putative FmdB family regulatory protein
MPIYEYECLNCGKQCEVFQKFNDEPLNICAECGGHMHKMVSRTSFILKGSGWYVTDYASPDRKKAKESDGKREVKTEAKNEAKDSPKVEAAAKS